MFFFVFTCISICVRILHCDNKQAERSRIEILYSVERFKNELLNDRIRYKCIMCIVSRVTRDNTYTPFPAHSLMTHTHTHPSLKHNECYEQSHTAHEQKTKTNKKKLKKPN